MKYSKIPIDVPNQIKLLKDRKLIIEDENKAKHYLTNVGYFRLSSYMHSFQISNGTHNFKAGTKFENIINLYYFDRQLRLLVFDVIERIEVAIRAKIVDEFSLVHGANWYEKSDLFWTDKKFRHDDFLEDIRNKIQNGNEQFLKHYLITYTDPVNPPSWMVFEILSIGTLSMIYEVLKDTEGLKTNVASHFNIPPVTLISWSHVFSVVRNICAHHGRLWNRFIVIPPSIPTRKQYKFLELVDGVDIHKPYLTFCCMQRMLEVINPTSTFKVRLKKLFIENPQVKIIEMGFPEKWEEETIWKS